MKVELLVTLRGSDTWLKGLILDSEEAPLPRDILTEINRETGTVRVIEEDKPDVPKPVSPISEKGVEEPTQEEKSVEPDIVPEKVEKTGMIEEYLCEICGKSFKSKRALKGHKMGAHKK